MDRNTDDYKLQTLINKSDTEPQEYWFSRQNQNKMVLEYAAALVIADSDITAEQAVNTAQSLIDTFYKLILQKTTKHYKG